MLNIVTPSRLRHNLIEDTLGTVEFSLAAVADATPLAGLFAVFFDEAGYKDRAIVFSRDKAEAWLQRVIVNASCPHIIARDRETGMLVGVTSYSLDDSFCVDPVAVLHTLYVVPGHRRSAIGRVLVGLATEMAKGDGAVAFHAPLASGMGEMKTLVNLFRRAGFDEIGTIMGRKL